ncbi:hypothetical protein DTO195F2_4440 [Paecilomyces variotii]|nr:hypothetical protein DTO195F2_4440 [Paecilomyces variotii]
MAPGTTAKDNRPPQGKTASRRGSYQRSVWRPSLVSKGKTVLVPGAAWKTGDCELLVEGHVTQPWITMRSLYGTAVNLSVAGDPG